MSLGNENGSVVYEVNLTDDSDAGNAAVLGQEAGDDEGDESEDASDEADDGVDHQFEGEEVTAGN